MILKFHNKLKMQIHKHHKKKSHENIVKQNLKSTVKKRHQKKKINTKHNIISTDIKKITPPFLY